MPSVLTETEMAAYHRDGFVLKRGMYSAEEVDLLRAIAKGEQGGYRFGTGRGGDGAARQLNPLGERRKAEIYHFERHGRQPCASPSVYDAVLFGERMITTMEALVLDPSEPRHQGENAAVTLHHRKFVMKDVESFLPPEGEDPELEGYLDASAGEGHAGQHSGNRWQCAPLSPPRTTTHRHHWHHPLAPTATTPTTHPPAGSQYPALTRRVSGTTATGTEVGARAGRSQTWSSLVSPSTERTRGTAACR